MPIGCVTLVQTGQAQNIAADNAEHELNFNTVVYDHAAWSNAGNAKITGTVDVHGFAKVYFPALQIGSTVALRVYVGTDCVDQDVVTAGIVGPVWLKCLFSTRVVGGGNGMVVSAVVQTTQALTTNLDIDKRPHLFVAACPCDCDGIKPIEPPPAP